MFQSSLTVICCVLALACARNPGFKARVTTNGLNYANGVAMSVLAKSVRTLRIPDQSGSAAGFHYWITSIRVTDFNPPTSSLGLIPGSGLRWSGSNAYIAVNGDFHYKKWFLNGRGSFDAKISGVTFGIEMDFGVDSTGRPSISAKNCGSSIGGVDFHFHGGMAWLYNLFRGKVGDIIKRSLNSQMCNLIVKQINVYGESKLTKLQVTVVLARKFMLDYRLVQAPTFLSQYMETAHKGEIYWASDATECPFTPPIMADISGTTNMLYLFVSDYMFQTIGYNAQIHGFLKYNLTQKDLPAANRGILNTTCDDICVGKLIPQIGDKYPNMNVELRMESKVAPVMNITPGGINVTCQGLIDLYARKPAASDTSFLISLYATMNTSVSVLVQNELLYAQINSLTMNLRVVKSAVGEVPETFLDFLINAALKAYIIPALNGLGKRGFPLPMSDDVTFQNTQLSLARDTLVVATDLKYTPGRVKDLDEPLKFQPYGRVNPM